MTAPLLDLSRRADLALHAPIVGDVNAAARTMNIEPIIIGAFARDLHLLYSRNITTNRGTADVDIALAVPDWATFKALREHLIGSGRFASTTGALHRLRNDQGIPIDLVPFGPIETADRRIVWPPDGSTVMSTFGFREALASPIDVILPPDVRAKVVSLPGLALLKLISWYDRHYRVPSKDAADLQMILRHYLDKSNEERLNTQFQDWLHEDDFQLDLVGPRMLGHDIRLLLNDHGLERVSRLVADESDELRPGVLSNEMNRHDPDQARRWLEALLVGLHESG